MNEYLSFNIPGGKEHLMLARHDGIVWREGETRPGRRHVESLSIDYDSLVWTFLQSLHWLLLRFCSQMPDPPHCLHLFLSPRIFFVSTTYDLLEVQYICLSLTSGAVTFWKDSI